ncbi:hypothetical protein BCR33DRAFT_767427 [Rhizoclosmatium globosum]|uniref:BZIP domain-containing protein n=1 Tax=Rhizoclosmatium globosum TaxID=329046 RepID=A0A1Y2C5I6_9FUNG|nr:hypothetical protein BCR33DRAFT_767427 [Rhizoclosmatium globosum]|eukprot:ORY41575.1 hypothetical protein BCR33DRAFT_767427 [Rhizoclosmatium globosum]
MDFLVQNTTGMQPNQYLSNDFTKESPVRQRNRPRMAEWLSRRNQSDHERQQDIAQRRTLQNRIAQRLCRKRKEDRIAELEDQVNELLTNCKSFPERAEAARLKALERRVQELEAENAWLRLRQNRGLSVESNPMPTGLPQKTFEHSEYLMVIPPAHRYSVSLYLNGYQPLYPVQRWDFNYHSDAYKTAAVAAEVECFPERVTDCSSDSSMLLSGHKQICIIENSGSTVTDTALQMMDSASHDEEELRTDERKRHLEILMMN